MRAVPDHPERSDWLSDEDLAEIRAHADWRQVFAALGLARAPRRGNAFDWWARSPFAEDQQPSFHMNDKGWYCFATQQGGGVLELVEQVLRVNCYEAGRWLIAQGLSSASHSPPPPPAAMAATGGGRDPAARGERKETEEPPHREMGSAGRGSRPPAASATLAVEPTPRVNHPIAQSLLPRLERRHPVLQQRGLSEATCCYLGCGYLGEDASSPLRQRIVFQVRGVQETAAGRLQPVILSHLGRAVTEQQAEADGKWRFYEGFHKSLELYNLDHLLLDSRAGLQARDTGQVLVVEGCFDVARLIEAGLLNGVATFGAHLSDPQIERLRQLARRLGVNRFRFWYDRDRAGQAGQEQALARLQEAPDLVADGFAWDTEFPAPDGRRVRIPAQITDPAECSVQQLQWLRKKKII